MVLLEFKSAESMTCFIKRTSLSCYLNLEMYNSNNGGMAERLNAPVLKTGIG